MKCVSLAWLFVQDLQCQYWMNECDFILIISKCWFKHLSLPFWKNINHLQPFAVNTKSKYWWKVSDRNLKIAFADSDCCILHCPFKHWQHLQHLLYIPAHVQLLKCNESSSPFHIQHLGCFHVCDLLLQQPLNKVNGGRDFAQLSALSKCQSDDLEFPLAPVCKHVTIMIRIDDRTFWFHCLANGTGEEICWIWTSVWFWHQKWYVGKWFYFFTSGIPRLFLFVPARVQGLRECSCQGREIRDLKEKFSCSYP